MYTQNLSNFKFFLCMFLFYNKRLHQKDWRCTAEENIVRTREQLYSTLSQQTMPATFNLKDELNEEEQVQVASITKFQTS